MRKKVLITVLSMTMLLGCSLTAEAVTAMGGTARVAKSTKETVYSSATGSYLGYASFGAYGNKGTLTVTAQHYKSVDIGYVFGGYKTAIGKEDVSGTSAKTGSKMWRVKVSGSSGRGIGWIKGE